jgi:hypothetical protein
MLPSNIIDNVLKFLTKKCDDCRRVNLKLKIVQACDDSLGCCYKDVCHDYCIYYCKNNHPNKSYCKINFNLPSVTIDELYLFTEKIESYGNHIISCNMCNDEVYIKRNFTWESYPK